MKLTGVSLTFDGEFTVAVTPLRKCSVIKLNFSRLISHSPSSPNGCYSTEYIPHWYLDAALWSLNNNSEEQDDRDETGMQGCSMGLVSWTLTWLFPSKS